LILPNKIWIFLHDAEYFVLGFFLAKFFDDVFLAKMSLFFCLSTEIYGTNTDNAFFVFIILQKISSLISLNRCMAYARKSFSFLFFSEGRKA